MSGGIGGMNDACGSLLGAVMFLGQVYGRDRSTITDREKLEFMMPFVGRLYKWFQKTFSSATCHDLCKKFAGGVFYDRNVPWQKELAEKAGVHDRCVSLAEETVIWVLENFGDDIKLRQGKQGD